MGAQLSNEFGPAGRSPNPIQRWEASHPYLIRCVIAACVIGWPAIRILGLATGLQVAGAAFIVLAAKLFASSRRRPTGADRRLREVQYLPWPNWLPGGRTPDKTDAESTAPLVPTLPSRKGPIGASPNPIQRLSIISPLASYVAVASVATGLGVGVIVVQGEFLAAGITWLAVVLLSLPFSLRHPLWRTTKEERFDMEFVYLDWPKWLPGRGEPEALLIREHERRRRHLEESE